MLYVPVPATATTHGPYMMSRLYAGTRKHLKPHPGNFTVYSHYTNNVLQASLFSTIPFCLFFILSRSPQVLVERITVIAGATIPAIKR